MSNYYNKLAYHHEYINGCNKAWTHEHRVQLAAAAMIPAGSALAEIGCGAGDAKLELCERIPGLRYFGVDLNCELWPNQNGFVAASAAAIPLASASVDFVLSMYAIEHMCRPCRFLDEAWRIARKAVIIIAPDFTSNPMASEWAGFSYGAGREKMRQGKFVDAILTGIVNRLIAVSRAARLKRLHSGATEFPILLNPRCLRRSGFVPDCDAVYPVCPVEIRNHYAAFCDFRNSEVFYNDGSTFGAVFRKHLNVA